MHPASFRMRLDKHKAPLESLLSGNETRCADGFNRFFQAAFNTVRPPANDNEVNARKCRLGFTFIEVRVESGVLRKYP